MCGCMHVCACALVLPVWPYLSGITPLSGSINILASWKDAMTGTDARNATQCIPTMQCNDSRVGWMRHTCVFHSLRAGEEPEPRRWIVASIWTSGALKSEGFLLAAAAARECAHACVCVRLPVLKTLHIRSTWEALRAQISSAMHPNGWSCSKTIRHPRDSGLVQRVSGCFEFTSKSLKKRQTCN